MKRLVGKPGDFSSVVFHTALGLLASTGLRAAEALGLDRNDVMPRDRPGTFSSGNPNSASPVLCRSIRLWHSN